MQFKKPYVRNPRINPSRVYATSPYRPTAILDPTNPNVPYLRASQQIILRATSPFAVSDQSNLDYIRGVKGIDSGANFETVGHIGFATGMVISAVAQKAMLIDGIKNIGMGLGGIAVPEPMSTGAGAIKTIVGIGQVLTYAASVLAYSQLGKTTAQMALTPEGRYYTQQYFKNLKTSMAMRPITTVMRALTTIGYEYATRKTPFKNLSGTVRTTLYLTANRVIGELGKYADEKVQLFGEYDQQAQLSYTNLSAIRGDLIDMQRGNPFLRSLLMMPKDPNKAIQKIAQAYGLGDEDYDPFRFADLREEYGVDIGTFGNGIVDMIGEMIVDTGQVETVIKSSIIKTVVKKQKGELYEYALENPDSELAKALFATKYSKEYKERLDKVDVNYETSKAQVDENKKSRTKTNKKYSKKRITKEKIDESFASLNVKELRELAKESGVKIKSNASRQEILNELNNNLDSIKTKTIVKKTRDKEKFLKRKRMTPEEVIEFDKETAELVAEVSKETFSDQERADALKTLRTKDLRKLAKESGVKIKSNARKQEILEAIYESEVSDFTIAESASEREYQKETKRIERRKEFELNKAKEEVRDKGSVSESEIGKLLHDKLLERMLLNYYRQYVSPNMAHNTKDENEININNEDLLYSVTSEVANILKAKFKGKLNFNPNDLQTELLGLLRSTTSEINNSAQGLRANIARTLNETMKDQARKGSDSFYTREGFSFDATLVKTALEKGRSYSQRYIGKLLNVHSSYRFHNEYSSFFIDKTKIFDPVRFTTELIFKAKLNNLQKNNRHFDSSDMAIKVERIKDLRITTKELEKEIKTKQEFVKREFNEVDKKLDEEILKSLGSTYEEISNNLKEEEAKLEQAKLDKNKDKIKESTKKAEKLKAQKRTKRVMFLQNKLQKDDEFAAWYNILVAAKNRLIEMESIYEIIKHLDRPFYYSDSVSGEKKEINEKNLTRLSKRLKLLEEKSQSTTERMTIEEVAELHGLQRGIEYYLRTVKFSESLNLVAKEVQAVNQAIAPYEINFANAMRLIKVMTSRIGKYESASVKYGENKKITVSEIIRIKNKNKKNLTEKENKILEEIGEDFEVLYKAIQDSQLRITEATQQNIKENRKLLSELLNTPISEFEREGLFFELSQLFPKQNEFVKKLTDAISGNKPVAFRNHYATEFFNLLSHRISGNKNLQSRIILNDRELFDSLEQAIDADESLKSIMNSIVKSPNFKYQNGRRFLEKMTKTERKNYAEVKEKIKIILIGLSPKVEGANYKTKGLLDQSEFDFLIQDDNLTTLAMALLATHRNMRNSTEYYVKLQNLSETRIIEWITRELQNYDKDFQSAINTIDQKGKEINKILKEIIEDFPEQIKDNSYLEGLVHQTVVNSVMSFYTSKVISGASADYNKFGAFKEFKDLHIKPHDSGIFTLSKSQIAYFNEYEKSRSEKISDEAASTIENTFITSIIKMLEESNPEIFKQAGIDKDTITNFVRQELSIGSKEPERKEVTREQILSEKITAVVSQVVNNFKKIKQFNISDKQLKQFEEKIKESIYRNVYFAVEKASSEIINISERVEDKELKESIVTNFIGTLKESGINEVINISHLHLFIRGETGKYDANIVFKDGKEEDKKEDVSNWFKNNKPTKENVRKILEGEIEDFRFLRNSKSEVVPLYSLRQLLGTGVLPKEWLDMFYEEDVFLYTETYDDEGEQAFDEDGNPIYTKTKYDEKEKKLIPSKEGELLDIRSSHFGFSEIAFFKGLPADVSEEIQNAFRETSIGVPAQIRKDRRALTQDERKKETYIKVFDASNKDHIYQFPKKNFDPIMPNSILDDFISRTEELREETVGIGQINSIEVGNQVKTTTIYYKDKDGKKSTPHETRYRVVRLEVYKDRSSSNTDEWIKEFKELYIPEADIRTNEEYEMDKDDKNFSEIIKLLNPRYTIGRNRYIKQGVFEEEDNQLNYLNYIFSEINNELSFVYNRIDDTEKTDYELRMAQNKIMNIFYDQRMTEDNIMKERVSDFLWLNPNHTAYEEFLYSSSVRLLPSVSDLAVIDNELFINRIKKQKIEYYKDANEKIKATANMYSLKMVPTNSNMLFKNFIVNGPDGTKQVLSITDMLIPFADSAKFAQRTAKTPNTIKNAKTKEAGSFQKEAPLVEPESMKYNPQFNKIFHQGRNLKNYLSDLQFGAAKTDKDGNVIIENGQITIPVYINSSTPIEIKVSKDFLSSQGATNFEDAIIMPKTVASNLYGHKIENDAREIETFKIINRHSGKQTIIVIDDELIKAAFGEEHEIHDVYTSQSSVIRRGQYGLQAELEKTKDLVRNDDGSFSYKDPEKKEKVETIYVDNSKSIKDNGINFEESKTLSGFTYYYTTDTREENYDPDTDTYLGMKAAGDDGVGGAIWSSEEILTSFSISEISYINEKGETVESLDPKNLFGNWMHKEKTIPKGSWQKFARTNHNLYGKKGNLKSSFLRREIKNSANSKILPDAALNNGEVGISKTTARAMGIWDENNNDIINDGYANRGIILRYPTVGRRSFIKVKYVLIDGPSKALRMSMGLHKLLNADHDGDNVSHFSLKGLEKNNNAKEIMEIISNSFSHYYDNVNGLHSYSDNKFHSIISGDEPEEGNYDQEYKFEKEAGTQRSSEDVYKAELGALNDERLEEFYNEASTKLNKEKDYSDSFERQKTLKLYSGFLTGHFDALNQMFEENAVNQQWFKDVISGKEVGVASRRIRELMSDLGLSDFKGLVTLLKEYYSQKTFDYDKHGLEFQKVSFETFFSLVKGVSKKTFEQQIFETLRAAHYDIFQNNIMKKALEKETDPKKREAIINRYIYRIQNQLKKIDLDEDIKKDFKKIDEIKDGEKERLDQMDWDVHEKDSYQKDLNKKSESKAANFQFKTNKEKITEDFKNIIKSLGIEDQITDLDKLTKEILHRGIDDIINKDIEIGGDTALIIKNAYDVVQSVGDEMAVSFSLDESAPFPEVKNIFSFIRNLVAVRSEPGKFTGIDKMHTSDFSKLMNVFAYSIKNLFISLTAEDRVGLAKDLKFVTYNKDGSSKTFFLHDLLYEKTTGQRITLSNVSQYLNREMINRFYFGVDMNKVGLFDDDLKAFEIVSESGILSEDKIAEINEGLHQKLDNEIFNILNLAGISRRASMVPLLYGKVAYDAKLFHGLHKELSDMLSPIGAEAETTHPLSVLMKAFLFEDVTSEDGTTSKQVIEERIEEVRALRNSITQSMLYQSFSEFIGGEDNETGELSNVLRRIFEYKTMFNLTPKGEDKTQRDITNIMQKYNWNETRIIDPQDEHAIKERYNDITIPEFIKAFKESLPEDIYTDSEVISMLGDIMENISQALSPKASGYNLVNNFFNMSTEKKLNYIIKIQQIRDGRFLKEDKYKNLGLTQEDIVDSSNREQISKGDQRTIFNFYSRAIKTLQRIGGPANLILKDLMEERAKLETLNKLTSRMYSKLGRTYMSDKFFMNFELDGKYLRGDRIPDNAIAQLLFFSRHNSGKIQRTMNEKTRKLVLKDYEVKMSETVGGAEARLQREDFNTFSEYLSLLAFESKSKDYESYTDIEFYAEKLLQLLSRTGNFQASAPNVVVQHLYGLNKIGSLINKDRRPITFGDLEWFRNTMMLKSNISIDEEVPWGDKKMISVGKMYQSVYLHYMETLRELEPSTYVAIREAFDDYLNFLINSGNTIQTFGLEANIFANAFFGMLIQKEGNGFFEKFENKTEDGSSPHTTESFNKEVESLTKLLNDYNNEKYYKTSKEISDLIINATSKRKTINEKQLEKILKKYNAEELKEVLPKLVETLNEVKKEKEKILKVNKDDVIDTYSLASLIHIAENSNIVDIRNKSLYNTFYQLLKYFKDNYDSDIELPETSEAAAKAFHEEIGQSKINARLHTAAIDVFMNHKTLEMFVKHIIERENAGHHPLANFTNINEIKEFNDPKNRHKYIVVDNETAINRFQHADKIQGKIYELSYITYDLDGTPIINQEFLVTEIDENVEAFLKGNGYTKDEILTIRKNISSKGFGHNEKVLEKFLEASKGKRVIGHNVEQDIAQINKTWEDLQDSKFTKLINSSRLETETVVKNLKSVSSAQDFVADFDKIPLSEKEVLEKVLKVAAERYAQYVRESGLYGGETFYSEEEKESYSILFNGILDGFREYDENNEAALKSILIAAFNQHSNLNLTLDNEGLQIIIQEYQKVLNNLKNADENSVAWLFELPELHYDEESGYLKFEPKAEGGVRYGKLEYDKGMPNQFVEEMFRMKALREIFPIIKQALDAKGFSYTDYEKYERLKNSLKDDDLIQELAGSESEEVAFHYYEYLYHTRTGDDITAYKNLKKAVDLNNATFESYMEEGEDGVTISSIHSLDEAKAALETKMEQDDSFFEYSNYEIDRWINDALIKVTNEMLGIEHKEKSEKSTTLYRIGWHISLDDNLTQDKFARYLGLDNQDDLTKMLWDLFNQNVKSIKRKFEQNKNGFVLRLRDGTAYDRIKSEHGTDEVIRKMAFTALISGQIKDKAYLSKYLYAALNDNFTLEEKEFKEFEDTDVSKGVKEFYDNNYGHLIKNQTIEDERNKNFFTVARRNFKNEVLRALHYGEWSQVQHYIENRPGAERDTEAFNNFKALIEKRIDFYKQNGLSIKKPEYNFDGKLNFSMETKEKIQWDDNNESIQNIFFKEIINEIYQEINELLYVDSIYTTNDKDNLLNEKISYSIYQKNIAYYLGDRIDSKYQKDVEMHKKFREAYKFVYKDQSMLTNIQKYQINFYDIIESFVDRRTGEVKTDLLFKELTEGYLSRTYKLTFLSRKTKKQIENEREYHKKKRVDIIKELKELKSFSLSDEDIKNMTDEQLLNLYDSRPEDKQLLTRMLEEGSSAVMKEIILESEDDLKVLTDMFADKESLDNIGLVSLGNFYHLNKMSYAFQELPAELARIERTIVRMQKFIGTTNPGVFTKIFFRGIAKNYHTLIGSDDPVYNNYRFFKEAKNTHNLMGHLNKSIKSNYEFLAQMDEFFKELYGVTSDQKEIFDITKFDTSVEILKNNITQAIGNIELYLQAVTTDSTLRTELNKNLFVLNNIKEAFKQMESMANVKEQYDELKYLSVKFYNEYLHSTYSSRLIMNHLHLMDLQNGQNVEDIINLLGVVNNAERAGVMYTPYHLTGRESAKQIKETMSGVSLERASKGFIEGKVDKLINQSSIGKGRKFLFDRITQQTRIHGLLLDMNVNQLTEDEAIAASIRRFFNYGDRSVVEREMAVFFPFISHMIRELDYHLEMMTNPRYVEFITNIAQGMETWYKEDEEDEDEAQSSWYNTLRGDYGWVPLGKNWGIKLGSQDLRSINILGDPFNAGYQRMNPIIKQINEMSKGNEFDVRQLGLGTVGRMADVFNNITSGTIRSPADVVPSLFYDKRNYLGRYNKYTPYKYRINYDYRNLNRELFFQDGTRRTPSRNPYTTARNTIYRARVNASINRRLRSQNR